MDAGAIDDLTALAALAREEKLWFHIDGAYGALGDVVAGDRAAARRASSEANSIAFDFHKWGQVPYDAGFLLVRDGASIARLLRHPPPICSRETRGLAAGEAWPCDFGPDLSRGFRALKTWFTLKIYGADAIGATIARSCALARYLEAAHPGRAGAGTAGAGAAQHRLLPLSGGGDPTGSMRRSSSICRNPASPRHPYHHQWTAGHPRGPVQPPHPARRY